MRVKNHFFDDFAVFFLRNKIFFVPLQQIFNKKQPC